MSPVRPLFQQRTVVHGSPLFVQPERYRPGWAASGVHMRYPAREASDIPMRTGGVPRCL